MNLARLGRKLRFAILWPGLFLYFVGSSRSRVLIVCGDEVLLVRDGTQFFYDELSWTLPGGGIHRGEEPSVAAVRELHEELNLSCEPDSLQAVWTRRVANLGISYHAHFFILQLPTKPIIKLQTRELTEAKWFKLSDTPSLPQKTEARIGLQLLADTR